jgi:hypothetical protein
MATSVVRVPEKTKATIAELARSRKTNQGEVVAAAVEEMKRRSLLEAGNEAYARLRADKKASREFDKESEAWERIGIVDNTPE